MTRSTPFHSIPSQSSRVSSLSISLCHHVNTPDSHPHFEGVKVGFTLHTMSSFSLLFLLVLIIVIIIILVIIFFLTLLCLLAQ